LVKAGDIEEHIAEGRTLGWDIEVEKFEGTGHCMHMVRDEERYWGAVRGVWDSAVGR